MSHYKANVRDLEFNLFEVLGLEKALATGEFGDLDGEAIRVMLAEAARMAQGPVAESFADGDRHPPQFDPDNHAVRLPDSFKASVYAWQEAGWPLLGLDEGLGDVCVPAAVSSAINEFLLGAQPAAFFYMSGPAMLNVMYRAGTPQQQRWAQIGIARNWGATMVLTEPDAGSDVGAARTSAVDRHDGTWHIEGVKRFITSGDSDDLFENIAHLVLARPQGAEPGTKGLSLFLVPKYLFDPETGEPGDRNGVFATGLEHKMGLTASATCELTFGQHGVPAVGWLVGDTHRGIAQMFGIMLYARLMVGVKSIATLSSAYLNALEFAKTRVQGPDLTRMSDKMAPRVRIISHPDVRRSLLTQKAYVEGLRALYLYAAAHQDPVFAQVVSDASPELASRINDLLLPIVKGAGSERVYTCLAESLQVLGGSGYLRDYPIEQYVRDAKIDSLYEGTTAVQAHDFVFRQVVRDGGETLGYLLGQIDRFCDRSASPDELAGSRARLAQALGDTRGMLRALRGYADASDDEPAEIYRVGLRSVPFLLSVGDLLIGWLLLRSAEVALAAVAADGVKRDGAFYRGKVTAAVFFAETVLPRLAADRVIIESQGLSEMKVDEDAF